MNLQTLLDYIKEYENSLQNIERVLTQKDPDIVNWSYNMTSFLPSTAKFTERLYCIVNKITFRQWDNYGNKYARFVNYGKGYSFTKRPNDNRGEQVKLRLDFDKKMQEYETIGYARLVGSDDPAIGTKVREYISRNLRNNNALNSYPKSDEGKRFVTCPYTGMRMLSLKSNYIESVLHMTVDEFKRQHPDFKYSADLLSVNIGNSLAEIDEDTGLTKHQLSLEKSKISGKKVGEDGLTGHQRAGKKTRATHMNKIDEDGLNGYQRIAKHRNETIVDGMSVQKRSLLKNYKTREKNNTGSFTKASNLSKIKLSPILELLNSKKIPYNFDNNEYFLSVGTEMFYFDLVIPSLKMAIEFDGRNFHPLPSLSETKWKLWRQVFSNKTADEVKEKDTKKSKLLWENRGFTTWRIYDDKYTTEQVNILLDYLMELLCQSQSTTGMKS